MSGTMSTAATATRRNRRPVGRSRGQTAPSDELEEVAMQVAHGCLDGETSEESPLGNEATPVAASLKQAVTEMSRTPKNAVQKASTPQGGEKGSETDAIFALPTPGRSGRVPPPPPRDSPKGFGAMPPPPTPPAAPPTAPPSAPPVMPRAAAQASPNAVPSSMPANATPAAAPVMATTPAPAHAGPAAGPEAAPAVPSKGNYREWLQARGQQAMNRSLNPGAAPPTPVAGLPSTPQMPAANSTPASPMVGPPVPPLPAVRMAPPAPPTPTQPAQGTTPWGPGCGDMQMQPQPQPQQWYPPVQNDYPQVPPMLPGVCPRNPMMPECAGQQSPMGGDAFQMMGCGQQVGMDYSGLQSPVAAASPFAAGASQGQPSPFGGAGSYGGMSPFGQQGPMSPADFAHHGAHGMASMPMQSCWGEDLSMHQLPPMQQQQPISPNSCNLPAAAAPMPQQLNRVFSHQEMMAAVMPAASFGLDREQLAQQLRAAAQCIDSYED